MTVVVWSWWLRQVTARAFPTLSFVTTFLHVGVKHGANLRPKLVLSNVCGGVAAVRVEVTSDLSAMADLLPVVIWLVFQAAPGKDVVPFLIGMQFPIGADLGVVDQAGLQFLLFLSSATLCVAG